ncbi:Postreplication repair E3 ubiquitin-protein ligase rad18 [Colletotrichum orbiculare MAFF 240422]|uniref:Postreplication repair E3 ubiquitin-protein ligase RAD18 n=1 Tax=Colletotrichum orbiculare (strain 104-T / ATCC 96160 / CBS 514.97 / LARS 414 / MAFF 240422) TaxID=1213857 RepID=N4VWJ3_COLOR|nr:Postreplication repair E3 ubiquitin-protein ligase rad18 [Colletotrichum orbiculare MAFF 240422]
MQPAATAEFDDVPDSTDWLSTPLSSLSAVEAALRCQVCKDFFKTPMLTSCSHTFCSLCIRRALSNDGKCPLCRASDQEHKLRSNWGLEEVVEAFSKARAGTLEFARAKAQERRRPVSPKRRLEDDEIETRQPETKRLRSSARLNKSKTVEASTTTYRDESDVSEPREEEEGDDATFTPDDGLVPCPICNIRLKEFQVFGHLDKCTGPPSQQPTRSSSSRTPTPNTPARAAPRTTPAPERLPALNYSMLKDIHLRKKMVDLGLATTGSRVHLERRHKEWITLWNANCDSARPKKRIELLHDLDVWERTQGSRAPVFNARPGAAVKDKEFDGAAWSAKHGSSFKDLVANARNSAKKTGEVAKREGSGSAEPAAAEGPSGAEVVMVDLTESTADHDPEATAGSNGNVQASLTEQPQAKPSTAAYYMQDGFSEQIPPVGVETGSQEAR